MFGYNGFGRLTGNETGSVGGGTQAGSQWGQNRPDRLFNTAFGGTDLVAVAGPRRSCWSPDSR